MHGDLFAGGEGEGLIRLFSSAMTRLLPLLFAMTTWGQPIPVEAESFVKQEKSSVRRWEIRKGLGASGGAYLQAVPDTRVTAQDKLIKG